MAANHPVLHWHKDALTNSEKCIEIRKRQAQRVDAAADDIWCDDEISAGPELRNDPEKCRLVESLTTHMRCPGTVVDPVWEPLGAPDPARRDEQSPPRNP